MTEHKILFKLFKKALRTIIIKFFLVTTTLFKTEYKKNGRWHVSNPAPLALNITRYCTYDSNRNDLTINLTPMIA